MYNKLWRKILDSSIWLEDTDTRLVWLTLLASMDSDCIARFSTVQNLADRARISSSAVQSAVTCLESPDRFKPEQPEEGRRIRRVEDGWLILRGPEYQEWEKIQQKRELARKRVQKHRAQREEIDSVTHVTRYSVTEGESNACNAAKRVTPVVLCSSSDGVSTSSKVTISSPVPKNGNGKRTSDPRHTPTKEIICKCYLFLNKGAGKCPWGDKDTSQFTRMLSRFPDQSPDDFYHWMQNYTLSENINPSDPPYIFIPKLEKYRSGPLNQYGHPKAQGAQ